jgi:hypothetical protein
MKQLSLGMFTYMTDNDDNFPSAYFHRAWDPADGGVRAGYVHWSGMIYPYVKNWDIFVSPGDALRGHAPTCFASSDRNSGKNWPAGQQADRCAAGDPRVPASYVRGGFIVDEQAPRLSYTVNSAVIPRLRNIRDQREGGLRVINQSILDSVSNTIMITGLVDNLECLNGQSIGGGLRNSSHRSTNAVTRDANNTQQWLGEFTDGTFPTLYALNFNRIKSALDSCRTNPVGTFPLITYHSWNRWKEGDNYGMSDGSAKFRKFAQTLSTTNYLWGRTMYTTATSQPILDPITGQQVGQ